MVDVMRSVNVVEGALAAPRPSRAHAAGVARAYAHIARIDADQRGHPLAPCDHAVWICDFCHGVGVHVLDRALVHECIEEATAHGTIDVTRALDVDAALFDPSRHVLVASQPSVLAYLAPDGLPDCAASVLGPGARVFSPHLKCSIAWWEPRTRTSCA